MHRKLGLIFGLVLILAAVLFQPAWGGQGTQFDVSSNRTAGESFPETTANEKLRSPVNFIFQEENGRAVILLEFSHALVDKKTFPAMAEDDEMPLSLERPVPFQTSWLAPDRLRLEIPMSFKEFIANVNRESWLFIWKPGLADASGRPLGIVGTMTQSHREEINPLVLYSTRIDMRRNMNGKTSNKLAVRPLEADIYIEDRQTLIAFHLTFNHNMVAPTDFDRPAVLEELPFTLNPPLPLIGVWTNARTLQLAATLTEAEYGARVCDQPFTLRWKEGWTTPAGLFPAENPKSLPEKFRQPFYISRFALLDFSPISYVRDGRSVFALSFNKPVARAELERVIRPRILVPRDLRGWPESRTYDPGPEPEWEVVFPEKPGAATLHQLAISSFTLANKLVVDLTGLASADKKSRLGHVTAETIVGSPPHSDIGLRSGLERTWPWRPYVELDMGAPVVGDRLKEHIKLDPPLDFSVIVAGRDGHRIRMLFDQPYYGGKMAISLLPGLSTLNGPSTKIAGILNERFLDIGRPQRFRFFNRPLYLSPSQPPDLVISGYYGDYEVRLKRWRVPEQHIPAVMTLDEDRIASLKQVLWLSRVLLRDRQIPLPKGLEYLRGGGKGEAARLKFVLELSEPLPDHLIRLEDPLRDRPRPDSGVDYLPTLNRAAGHQLLDLGKIPGAKPGLYIIQVTKDVYPAQGAPNGNSKVALRSLDLTDNYRIAPEQFLIVSLSDLGLAARLDPRGVAVWVVGLTDGRPAAKALVEIYDRNNQKLAQGRTGADGLFLAGPEACKGYFILVKKGEDLNYLTFNETTARDSLKGDPVGQPAMAEDHWPGRTKPDETSSLIWPGETSSEMPSAAFVSSMPDRYYPASGQWEAFIQLPRTIYQAGETVSARAIVRDAMQNQPNLESGLVWRLLGVEFRPGAFAVKRPVLTEKTESNRKFDLPLIFSRVVNEQTITDGRPDLVEFNLHTELPSGPYMVTVSRPGEERPVGQAEFVIRPAAASLPADLKPIEMDPPPETSTDYQVPAPSYRPPPQLDFRAANEANWVWEPAGTEGVEVGTRLPVEPVVGRALRFQLAARSQAGPIAGRRLKLTVFKETPRFLRLPPDPFTYPPHTNKRRPPSLTLVEMAGYEPVLDRYGRVMVEFTPVVAGTYEAVIDDPAAGWRFSRRFEVFGSITPEEELAESVDLYFDRLRYQPGETARLIVSPPFPGQVWLTIESGSTTRHLILGDGGWKKPVGIQVTPEMRPNAWVTAMVVAPVGDGRMARRALGTALLEIDPDWLERETEALPPEAAAFFNASRKILGRCFDMYEPRRIQGAGAE